LFKIVPGGDEELFLDAEILLGHEITEVLIKLGDNSDLTQSKIIIEDYLLSKIPKSSQQTDVLDKCIDEILKTKGCLKIEELASRCHVSKRTVERQFSSKLGTSPLHYSRIVRCNEVLKYLSNGNNHTSFDVVEHFNYYDQPHFINDFRKFADESPQLYLNNDHMLERILTID
jgi:AraC-like DNA-binding protein